MHFRFRTCCSTLASFWWREFSFPYQNSKGVVSKGIIFIFLLKIQRSKLSSAVLKCILNYWVKIFFLECFNLASTLINNINNFCDSGLRSHIGRRLAARPEDRLPRHDQSQWGRRRKRHKKSRIWRRVSKAISTGTGLRSFKFKLSTKNHQKLIRQCK